MFTTSKEAITWIESVKRFGDKLDLSRMELACEILGHPEQKLPVIHIAGTNGKGSTLTYLKHILLEHGYHVGTFTSPYIVRFNERITYDYNDISDEELLDYVNQVYYLSEQVKKEHNEIITFFELITLISFLYFADREIDFVLYEVGLGGRLDATNVVTPIISAITSISYDHMNVLGDTLEEIALNKLGIVKEGVPLVTSITQRELYPLFTTYTNKKNSEITFIQEEDITDVRLGKETTFRYKDNTYTIALMGEHQTKNASLAIEVLFQLEKHNYLTLNHNSLQLGLLNAFWPGRMEQFGNIILDGAHNIGGMVALKETIISMYPNHYVKALYTSMMDKEYFDIIQVLESFVDEVTFTTFDYPRCETAQNLYDVSSHPNKHMSEDSYEAFDQLKRLKKDEILLITGSLYFISYMRKHIKSQE